MKKILCALFLIAITFVSTFLFSVTNVFAATTEDVESKIISFTDNDTFTYNSTTYSIQDYKNSINNNSLFGSTMDLGISYYYAYSDDPIVNIIPKELFCTVGVETYIGREYGFFIKTVSETYYDGDFSRTSNNYRSYVIVFDITNNTDLVTNVDRAIFTVTNLFSLEYITISEEESYLWRKDDAMYTEYLNDNYDYYFSNNIYYEYSDSYCVLPLYDLNDNAKTNRYYLNDISFGAHLQNEQAYNANDDAYVGQNDIGSYFTRLDYIYDGKYIVEGSWADVDYGALLNIAIETGLSYIPYIGDALSDIYSTVSTGIEVIEILDEGLSDKEYDSTNDSYITQAYYVNRDDQLQHYGYLTKCAYFALNTNSDISILYEENDYARLEYTIGHSALGEEPNLTRMTNEIALKIVDRDCNLISCATSSNDFALRQLVYKELNIGENNKMFLLDKGKNYFYFTPVYSGKYVINVENSSSLKLNFAGIIKQGTNVSIETTLNKGTIYYLSIENLGTQRICQTFEFDVSTNTENITVKGNNNYLVKIDSLSGFKKISFNNSNINAILLSDDFIQLKNNETNNFYYKFNNSKDYYVLLQNNASSAITRNLLIENNFTSINIEETTIIQLSKGDYFYKFVPSTSGKYSMVVFDSSSSEYDFNLYTDNTIESFVPRYGSNFVKYDCNLQAGKTYYIGYENSNISSGQLEFAVKTNENVFSFYINGELVEGNVCVAQGQEFTLDVKMNNILVEGVEVYNLGSTNEYTTKVGNVFRVNDDAPTTSAYDDVLAVVDINDNEIEYINLVYKPTFSIDLDTYTVANQNTANKLGWSIVSSNVKDTAHVVVELTFIDDTTKMVTFNITSGTRSGSVTLPALDEILTTYDYQKAIATAEIKSIKFYQCWYNEEEGKEEYYENNLVNSYPNDPDIALDEFYSEPVEINMMFNGGTGTTSDPYKIINEWQLNNVRNMTKLVRYGEADSDYMITDHFIVCNSFSVLSLFEPLPILKGTFKGYTESNSSLPLITITFNNLGTGSSYRASGLFEFIWDGTVSYIGVNVLGETNNSGSNVIRKGAICGYMSNGTIEYCNSYGSFAINTYNTLSSNIGGIVGEVVNGTISNCKNYMVIDTYGTAGGIVGKSYTATIQNCYNYGSFMLQYSVGSVTSESDNPSIGGIAGFIHSSTTISDCFVYTNESNNTLIRYEGNECKDKQLKPCLGFVVGRSVNGSVQATLESGISIYTGKLQSFKAGGFLGIGATTYNQLQYVSTGTSPCGKVG